MARQRFSFKELNVPVETQITFIGDDRFTAKVNEDESIDMFFNDRLFERGQTLSGGAKLVWTTIKSWNGMEPNSGYDGPAHWKIGETSLKEYRKSQRTIIAKGMSREELESYYINTGSTCV